MNFISNFYSYLDALLVFDQLALFVLRVFVGVLFVIHGAPKLKNLRTTWQNFEAMGFKPGKIWGTIPAFLESIGGFFIIIGFLVQPIAVLLVAQMGVAAGWRIKNKHSFVNGYELDLLLIVALGILVVNRSEILALDNYLRMLS
ncbi:MAG TPA: DoxX family protein [Candidatus Paceibacterota bacterium]